MNSIISMIHEGNQFDIQICLRNHLIKTVIACYYCQSIKDVKHNLLQFQRLIEEATLQNESEKSDQLFKQAKALHRDQ